MTKLSTMVVNSVTRLINISLRADKGCKQQMHIAHFCLFHINKCDVCSISRVHFSLFLVMILIQSVKNCGGFKWLVVILSTCHLSSFKNKLS